jgi:transcriptional regulator with XRE-family HTH domain
MSTVSENLKYLRKLKGYTQEQFAARIGIKRSLVGAYEEARANPNEIYLNDMAEVLGVEVEHLLNENLRERGRKLGPGMILKLNPELPDPVSEVVGESQSTPNKLASEEREDTLRQTNLFPDSGVSDPVGGELPSQEVPASRESVPPSIPASSLPATDFLSFLSTLLSAQPGYRLFSEISDLPLKGTSVIGKLLSKAESIPSDQLYVLVTPQHGVLFRRVFNQLSVKGTLILSSDFPGKDILELPMSAISEVYQYMGSFQTTAPAPVAPVHQLRALTEEMMKLLNARD